MRNFNWFRRRRCLFQRTLLLCVAGVLLASCAPRRNDTEVDPALFAGASAAVTTSSAILHQNSRFVPGAAIQTYDTPVVISACSLEYQEPLGSDRQSVVYNFSVYNQTEQTLRYTAITDSFDFANLQEAFVFNLKPHEFRVIRSYWSTSEIAVLLAPHRPTFLLCGSGPEITSTDAILSYASMARRNLDITRIYIPTMNGERYSPFRTLSGAVLDNRSAFVPGVPIQPLADDERSTYRPNVPPRHAVPFVLQSCSLTYKKHILPRGTSSVVHLSLYNQTIQEFKAVRISVKPKIGAPLVATYVINLMPHEFRNVNWPLSASVERRIEWKTRPSIIQCGVGPGVTRQGITVPYNSLQ